MLSGGQWIGVTNNRDETLFLEYDVNVPKTGKYEFYSRKFWLHGPFRWRFDSQPWQEVGKNVALLDDAPLRQFVGANWVDAGSTTLTAGHHTARIELLEKTGGAAFDAFLLTMKPFIPRGKLKPGEKYNRAPEGWFPFEPDPDSFTGSPIDLRSLNEKFAGENGFIQAKGEEFVHQKTGQPVRFWAVNTSAVNLDKGSVDLMARNLAKMGVNMVRIHGAAFGPDFRQVDKERMDKLFYFISALKKEGIYTSLSIYFPLWLNLKQENGFAGYTGNTPFSLLYFNPDFQAIYRSWWKTVLTTPNPYTGKSLSEEPAVAVLEMVNEDSTLFWTFTPYNAIPGPQIAILEKQFGTWLAGKYGSLSKAFQAWGNKAVKGDDPTAGRAGFMPLWEVFNVKDQRAQDTAAFLTLNEKAFYQSTYDYLKKDLGFKGSVYGSNWITADATILGPLDKYANSVADFMDRHGYFGGPHEGDRAGYSINKGDRYNDRSALLFSPNKEGGPADYSLPLMDIRYNGMPSTITEINWTPPNRYRADMPLICAAYGLLQGTDAFYFFATGSPTWEEMIGKFSVSTPVTMAQFPAAAYIYRKELVKPGDAVVDVNLKLDDLMALKGAPVSAPVNLDEFRAKDIPPGKTVAVDKVASLDPLAFLVGKVAMSFSKEGGKSRIADLTKYIDRPGKTVRSATGELLWDFGNGKVTVNAPQAQAVTGFLARAGEVKLSDVTIDAGMEYGSVTLISLDDKPISQSGKMLLQVMSEENNYGWEAPGSGLRTIANVGSAPIVLRKFSGTVTLKRRDAAQLKVTALDLNGYRTKQVKSGGSIMLSENTLYYLIEK